jgi:hypothetical protein
MLTSEWEKEPFFLLCITIYSASCDRDVNYQDKKTHMRLYVDKRCKDIYKKEL